MNIQLWVTSICSCITAATAIFATFKALSEWRRSIQQRKEELSLRQREFRHKQATFARDLVKEIFADKKARNALKLLDWIREVYEDDAGVMHEIKRDEIQQAMRPFKMNPMGDENIFSDKEKFVRLQFEALYDYFEQLENMIGLSVVAFEDVESTFRYYMRRLLRPNIEHFEFLDYYEYPKAKAFLLRYKSDR